VDVTAVSFNDSAIQLNSTKLSRLYDIITIINCTRNKGMTERKPTNDKNTNRNVTK